MIETGQIRQRCPFCFERVGSEGSRENVSIDIAKGVYFCWRCGSTGRLNRFSAEKLGVDLNRIIPAFSLDQLDDKPTTSEHLPPGYTPLYPWSDVRGSFVLRPYIKFLFRRGIKRKQLKQFRLGVVISPPKDRWNTNGCIVFPLLDKPNTGYVLRHPKRSGYRNAKGLARQVCFYNGRALRKLDRVYVVEGPLDTIRMDGHAVGTLGTSVTEDQLDRLAAYRGEVVFAQDGDAWRWSMVLARLLTLRGHPAKWVRLPSAKDPGDLGYDNVVKLPTHDFFSPED